MKLTRIISVFVLMIVCGSSKMSAQSRHVNDILDAFEESMGDAEHWAQLQSWQRTSKRKSGLEVTCYAKKPDQFQLVFGKKGGNQVVKSYDGKEGWLDINGSYSFMRPGEEIEMAEEPEFYEDLQLGRQLGYEITYEGEDHLQDVACFKLKMVKSDKDVQWYWINQKNGRLEMVGEFSEDKAHDGIFYTTRFLDYRLIDGFWIPFTELLIRNGQDTTTIPYTDMQVNPDLDDQLFRYRPNSARNALAWIKDVFKNQHLPEYTFLQETIIYKDSKADTSTWYETIVFPDKFRIDFGSPLSGNTNLNVADTLYAFREGALAGKMHQPHEFLLIEGGIYEMDLQSAMDKLVNIGIDTSVFHIRHIDGEKIMVIGSTEGDLKRSQIWISMAHGKIVKSIGSLHDGRFYEANTPEFFNINGHVIPKYIYFYVDNELIQSERYYDINIRPEIPKDFFNHQKLSKNHWYLTH